MEKQDVIRNHLVGALLASAAEAAGNEELSRCLHAETKLRLMTMSEEELWELAKVARLPDRPIELVYRGFQKAVENLRATAGEWLKDLATVPKGRKRMPDKILFMGGTSSAREELACAFTQAGFVTAEASDYPEAIAQLENFKPDIVIIDEALPSRDSLEVSSKLSNDFDLPVVVLGRDVSDEVWQKVMEAGVDLYQKRPFSYVLLIARVKAILRRYKGEVVKRDSVRRMSREE